MRQAVYVSSAVREFSETELDQILDGARASNRETGITGILFYLNGNFFQVLEGEAEILQSTLIRIRRDIRHHGFILLYDIELEQRNFPDFRMAYKTWSIANGRVPEDVAAFVAGDTPTGTNRRLGVMLDSFLRVNAGRSYKSVLD